MSSFRLGVVVSSPGSDLGQNPTDGAGFLRASGTIRTADTRKSGDRGGLAARKGMGHDHLAGDAVPEADEDELGEEWEGGRLKVVDTGNGLDLRSGADIVECLSEMGVSVELLKADGDLDLALREREVDACILALHGPVGGSGAVQSLLSMRGIPYAGHPAGVASLAFDKVRSRQMMAYHNLPVPAAVAFGTLDEALPSEKSLLGWPCVLKPRRGANGAGVVEVHGPEALEHALTEAGQGQQEFVLERAIEGQEYQVVLLDDRVLGVMEIARHGGIRGTVAMSCPPQLSRSQLEGLHNLARRSAAALGVSEGFIRVDIIRSERLNEVVLEVEASPPLHRDSVVMRVARAAGMTYESAIAEVIARIPRTSARRQGWSAMSAQATLQ